MGATRDLAKRVAAMTSLDQYYLPMADMLDERALVNGIVGLLATEPFLVGSVLEWREAPAVSGDLTILRPVRALVRIISSTPRVPLCGCSKARL